MKQENLRIGFIGLGKMGSGICANIQKAGYELTVYNRSHEKTRVFANNGASAVKSIQELVANSDIIFTSLMDDQSVLDMCTGDTGILANLTDNKIHVGLTTIQPATSEQLQAMHQQLNCHYIAAPVVGRPDAAAAGKLISFLAGDLNAIDIITSVVASYTVKQVITGNVPSHASALKICTNYMAMTQLAMLGEIFSFAEKMGLEQDRVLMIADLFFAGNPAMTDYAAKIAMQDFDNAGFDLTAGLKDALIFESAFSSVGVKAGAIATAKDHLIAANANGLGRKDWSALTLMTRRAAGLDT